MVTSCPSNRGLSLLLSILAIFSAPASLSAWEDHDQLTTLALADEAFASAAVTAEPLEMFLEAEKEGLVSLFATVETRANKELSYYLPLPANMVFSGAGNGPELRAAFLRVLRVNPNTPFSLFVQTPAWGVKTRPALPLSAVDLYESRIPNPPFEKVLPGESVTILEVLSAASDEPDYGMDIGLYEDTGTEVGKIYGFGKQPFGNPALSYGSQASIHMAFPREDPIIKLAAAFSQKSLLPYRVMLYEALSRFAFSQGRDYWGWRFAGWALHYLGDMTQPYHARMLPNLTTTQILVLNLMGRAEDKAKALVLLSNHHVLLEDYFYGAMAEHAGPSATGTDGVSPIYAALRGASPFAKRGLPPWRRGYEQDVLAKRAYDRAGELDHLLSVTFPAKYVSDPAYEYGQKNVGATREYDPYSRLRAENPAAAAKLDSIAAEIFADYGNAVRTFTASVRDTATVVPPRKAVTDLRALLYILVLLGVAALVILLFVAGARKRRARGIPR
jgi:hypothetical protein